MIKTSPQKTFAETAAKYQFFCHLLNPINPSEFKTEILFLN